MVKKEGWGLIWKSVKIDYWTWKKLKILSFLKEYKPMSEIISELVDKEYEKEIKDEDPKLIEKLEMKVERNEPL